jgi:uncharacterized protein YutE (UPF0331/DUF86 family)
MSDVAAQKVTTLQRCVARARQELTAAGTEFAINQTAQDAAILNVLRACETAIDLANMLIRKRRLGIPSESRESFAILTREKIIDAEFGARLQKMVGFRNLAVHRYRELDMKIVEAVIRTNLDDLLAFAENVRGKLPS